MSPEWIITRDWMGSPSVLYVEAAWLGVGVISWTLQERYASRYATYREAEAVRHRLREDTYRETWIRRVA